MPQLAPRNKAEADCAEELKKRFPPTCVDEADRAFLVDSEVYVRFSRARKGDVAKAAALLESCIAWRKEYKPYALTREELEPIMKKGLTTTGGFCNEGRPVLIVRLGLENEFPTDMRVKQLVYLMEEIQRKGYETATWIIDFTHLGERKKKDPYVQETRKLTSRITQDYYPEKLGKMYLFHGPWYINMLITLSKPFVDSNTRLKVHKSGSTLEELAVHVRTDQLPKCMGGVLDDSGLVNLDHLPAYSEELVKSVLDQSYFKREVVKETAKAPSTTEPAEDTQIEGTESAKNVNEEEGKQLSESEGLTSSHPNG